MCQNITQKCFIFWFDQAIGEFSRKTIEHTVCWPKTVNGPLDSERSLIKSAASSTVTKIDNVG